MSNRGFRRLSEILVDFWDVSADVQTQASATELLRTGFLDLDALLGGISRSTLTVCAAASGTGTSVLAAQMARNAAFGQSARVALFSIQHPAEVVARRLLAAESGVDSARLQAGQVSESEECRVMDGVAGLSKVGLYVDDSCPISVSDIRAKLTRLSGGIGGVDLVVIDGLNLLAAETDLRAGAPVDANAMALRELARDLEIPIVATTSLRFLSSGTSRIPQLVDIGGEGIVEELADVVMFIYREDVHVTREDWETRNFDQPYTEGITKLIVAKHRNGPTGVVHLRFRNHLSRFEDLSA